MTIDKPPIEEMRETAVLIRRLYEISIAYESGFQAQIEDLLRLGCEVFGPDIGILSRVVGEEFAIRAVVGPEELGIKIGQAAILIDENHFGIN